VTGVSGARDRVRHAPPARPAAQIAQEQRVDLSGQIAPICVEVEAAARPPASI